MTMKPMTNQPFIQFIIFAENFLMKIAALVSGGVDSSVTIPLLKEVGYDPEIFYIKIGMEDEKGFYGLSVGGRY